MPDTHDTALHKAVRRNDIEAIRKLLHNSLHLLNETNAKNNTALHLAVSKHTTTGVVRLLLQSRAEVNTLNLNRKTPMDKAIETCRKITSLTEKLQYMQACIIPLREHGALQSNGKPLIGFSELQPEKTEAEQGKAPDSWAGRILHSTPTSHVTSAIGTVTQTVLIKPLSAISSATAQQVGNSKVGKLLAEKRAERQESILR